MLFGMTRNGNMRRILSVLALVAGWLVLPVQQARAHPHEFVEMWVEAKFNAKGQITGFRYSWLFDEFFSAYALEGHDANKNGKPEQSEVNAVMDEILKNIGPINYFTKFDGNGVVPEFDKGKPVSAEMKKRKLHITFDIPFKQPVTVDKKPLRYAIYDEEFYVSMTHSPSDKAVRLTDAKKGCDWELDSPEPGEDIEAFASSLGKDQSGGNDLGVQFAEWVEILCK